MAHPEFGHKIVDQFRAKLEGIGTMDKETKFEGKRLVTIFRPIK